MAVKLFACGTDNDGYPNCMGDGSTCGPQGKCTLLHTSCERRCSFDCPAPQGKGWCRWPLACDAPNYCRGCVPIWCCCCGTRQCHCGTLNDTIATARPGSAEPSAPPRNGVHWTRWEE